MTARPERLGEGRLLIETENERLAVTVEARADGLRVVWPGHAVRIEPGGPPSIAATGSTAAAAGARILTAPLAGVIVRVLAAEGDDVAAGQPLVLIEAMKMEHSVEAPVAGRVARLARVAGDRVQAGDLLVELA